MGLERMRNGDELSGKDSSWKRQEMRRFGDD